MTFRYQGSVCSDLNDTKIFIKNILEKVEEVIADEDLMFDLKLILNELIINGVVHGNKSDREKCVDLYLEITSDKLRIEVCDEGHGIKYEDTTYNPDELKNCGRGLVLVYGLSDEVFIENNKVVALKSI